jgi:hypothetical protein
MALALFSSLDGSLYALQIVLGNNYNALGQLWEVAKGWIKLNKLQELTLDPVRLRLCGQHNKANSLLSSRMSGRMPILSKHVERVPLDHTFLAEYNGCSNPVLSFLDHQNAPVTVAIEGETSSGWPLVTGNNPQHDGMILLVEGVACINDVETPFLLHVVSTPHVLHLMDATLDTAFKACPKLVDAACFLSFIASHKKHTLCKITPPGFAHSDGTLGSCGEQEDCLSQVLNRPPKAVSHCSTTQRILQT